MSKITKQEVKELIIEGELQEQAAHEVFLDSGFAVNGNTDYPQVTPAEANALEAHLIDGVSRREAAEENGLPISVYERGEVKRAMDVAMDNAGFTLIHIAEKVYKHSNDKNQIVSLKALELGCKLRSDAHAPKKLNIEQRGMQLNMTTEVKAESLVNGFITKLSEKKQQIQKGESDEGDTVRG